MRRFVLVALAAGVAGLAGAAGSGSSAEGARAAKAHRLVAFGSCDAYLDYVKPRAVEHVHAFGFGGLPPVPHPPIPAPALVPGQPIAPPVTNVPTMPAAPAPALAAPARGAKEGVDYSGTNVQEEGVDEPDLVKTDGSTLFVVANGRLSSVDVSGRRPRLLDSLKLANPASDLLLHGKRLLVLASRGYFPTPDPVRSAILPPHGAGSSTLTEVDVSNPARLQVARTLTLDGSVVAARLVDGTVRLVSAAQIPAPLPFKRPDASTAEAYAAAAEHNRLLFAQSGAPEWLPTYSVKRRGHAATPERPLVQCRHVRRPAAYSGLGMLTVVTIDLEQGLAPVTSTAVMTDSGIVYASPESLYVATAAWSTRFDPSAPAQRSSDASTVIHRFDITQRERALYRGSGRVAGHLLSQWSLSEHRGVLRVVTTEVPASFAAPGVESESSLTTLRLQDGALVQAGRVGGLGRGERVYAVRFVGDVGFVVTFRQVDPLYTIDLADPDRPRLLGELKIPGYSSYLHPIGEDLLLGVGQDATDDGMTLGLQLSVFDVSDLRRPTRLHQRSIGGNSDAESDHRAFLFWPRTGLVVIPAYPGAMGFRVGRARGIDKVGEVEHGRTDSWENGIVRSLVVRDAVLTVSPAGVKANGLAAWDDRGWVALPEPDRPDE